MAPSIESVQAMRSGPGYTSLERRWQLPVYYQLRWKEIVGGYEAAIASSTTAEGWALGQSGATWKALSTCWDRGVFIPELAPRFWRLSLQVSPQDSLLVEPLRLKILDHCTVWLLAQDFHRGFHDYRGGYQSRRVGIENGGLWACRCRPVSRKNDRSAPS
jgi:hypothetical protein